MKTSEASDNPSPALIAMRRAARGVLQEAVDANRPIPIWTGTTTLWEVPKKQLEALNALGADPARQAK
ncbi:MAG: hypothetical protein ACI8W8_002470 [Rhodothermales bacterium]|jgi:hypothetical protein